MRRVTLLLVAVVLVAGAALLLVTMPELLDQVGVMGDAGRVREITRSFLEDIQFKDFTRAASYHAAEEQATVDIPFLIERIFKVKPEMLDIMEYEILFAKIDSSGLRARVKSRIKLKDLLRNELHDRELVLYFYRTSPEAPWYMRLESSLRKLDPDEDKLH